MMNNSRSRRILAAALTSSCHEIASHNNPPPPSTFSAQMHVTNAYTDPPPSTSGTQLEFIFDQPRMGDECNLDFSDDDSVIDPLYVPDVDFDERTISDLFDLSQDILSNSRFINNIDNGPTEQLDLTPKNTEIILSNTKQTFIAKYPGPIYIANNFTTTDLFKNKNKLKHPMIQKPCSEKCRRKCSKISDHERNAIWEQYWNMNFQARRCFLNKFVQFSQIKRRRVDTTDAHSKNESRFYFLPGQPNNELIPVCKRFFLDTLGLRTDGPITELSKANKKGLLFASMEGEKRGGKRKEIDRNSLREHILSYKPTVTHYRRHNSPFTKYLPRELTVSEMHLDFKKKYPRVQCTVETYRKEIKQMKISFNMPRGDICEECFIFTEEKKKCSDESLIPYEVKQKYAEHKNKSDKALETYKDDARQKNSIHVKYFSMDLQKVILLPAMPQIKEAVFISRLITFNLTFAPINKLSPDPATCILWHEGQAGREASNIVDAIFTFIKNERDCHHLHIWADNCTAQNKNWTLFTALATIVNAENAVETITLSYLTKGHTHMTADSVHGNIERKMKKQGNILDFEDFMDVVKNSRQKMRVIELNYYRNWPKKKRAARKNDAEDSMKSFLLNQVVQAKFVKGSRNLLYKTCFDEPFSNLDFLIKKHKVTEVPEQIKVPRGIPTRKKEVIVAKLVPLMPETRRAFWKEMPVNDESIDLHTGGEMLEESV